MSAEPEVGSVRRLRPGKLQAALMTLIGLAFVVGATLTMSGWERWGVTAFFGACALVGLIELAGFASYLELRPDGFTCCSLGGGFSLAWGACSAFRVGGLAGHTMVVFDLVGEERQALSRLNRALAGGSGALPDTYGMKPQALADLLNAYRHQALDQPSLGD